MRLKMRILSTVLLVLGLVEFSVADETQPKEIGFVPVPNRDSIFLLSHQEKISVKGEEAAPHDVSTLKPSQAEALAKENEKQDDSKSSIELKSTQNKTSDSNTGSLASNKEKVGGTAEANKKESQEDELPSDKRELNKNQSKKFYEKNNKPTNKSSECPPTTVDCLCFEDKIIEHVVHLNLNTISVIDPRTGHRKCFADEDPLAACETRNCVIIPNKNFDTLFKKGKKDHPSNNKDNAEKPENPHAFYAKNDSKQSTGSIVIDTLVSSFYPMEFTYPRAYGERDNGRVERSPYGSNLCRIPSLANSEVTCWKWPNWQTCKQTCIYGHGLDNGGKTVKEASFNCRNTENRWKPHVIRDCEPYLNCKVHLKSPGDLNCVEPTDGPAYCDINCADYDDYVGHGKVRWKCEEKPHGAKQNKLPHCAEFEEAELRLNPPH